MNILDALDDPKVFAPFFKGPTWNAWRVFLKALFAIPMSEEQLAIYTKHTRRSAPPTSALHEAWLVIGRRGGKSFTLATIAVFLACFKDWRPYLGPGETGTIMIIARDRRQARVIKRFITGLLKNIPMLAQLIEAETQESIQLRNRISIEIHTASFRSTRGYTIVAALLDEIAFWEVDEHSSEPDVEVVNAIKPGMATIPEAMLLCASSPHARKGALWGAYSKYFGKDTDDILVWQAATREMNQSVPQRYIDRHIEEDPHRAAAEYGAQFRTDLEALLSKEAVEACVTPSCRELPYSYSQSYRAFCDPSGGSADSMTLAVGHFETGKDIVVIDCLREVKPPFSPEAVAMEFATVLKSYHLGTVTGDRFGGQWPVEQFSKMGIHYTAAEKPKSALYTDLLAYINSRRIELLDNPRCNNQLVGLERRVARGGKDSIDHAPGAHDDLANVVAGIASGYASRSSYNLEAMGAGGDSEDPDGARAFRVSQFWGHIMRNA
jgi:hypothetical protein